MTKTGGKSVYLGPEGPWTEQACIYSDLFPGWQFENEIEKPQVCINSNNSSIDCKQSVTWNGNLQPEIEYNE